MADCIHCPSGVLDEDGYCPCCGKTTHSRRVPGVRSAAELRHIAETQGVQAALMVASTDAVYRALKPGKAAMKR